MGEKLKKIIQINENKIQRNGAQQHVAPNQLRALKKWRVLGFRFGLQLGELHVGGAEIISIDSPQSIIKCKPLARMDRKGFYLLKTLNNASVGIQGIKLITQIFRY